MPGMMTVKVLVISTELSSHKTAGVVTDHMYYFKFHNFVYLPTVSNSFLNLSAGS